jgi:hypothetical protein
MYSFNGKVLKKRNIGKKVKIREKE